MSTICLNAAGLKTRLTYKVLQKSVLSVKFFLHPPAVWFQHIIVLICPALLTATVAFVVFERAVGAEVTEFVQRDRRTLVAVVLSLQGDVWAW